MSTFMPFDICLNNHVAHLSLLATYVYTYTKFVADVTDKSFTLEYNTIFYWIRAHLF